MATVTRIDPTNLTLQSYEPQDENLISQFDVTTALTGSSYVEFFIYDNNQTLLYSTLNYNSYTVLADGQAALNNEISQFNISPGEDTENQGFDQGEYISFYNFLTKQVGDPNTNLFIQEISSDRTEIRLDSNILSNLDIVEQTNNFIQFRDESTYFVDFYLNFGSNDLIIANNIQLKNATTNDPTILIKLYEPLPTQFNLKDELWVVTTLNEPEAFNVNFPPQPIEFIDFTQLSGPNYNIPIKDQVNNSTLNLSYTDLISGSPTSSLDQLNSLMDSSSLSISVDYTDFSDFIHFSSAQTRLENFSYKVGLIEGFSSSIANLTDVTSSATSTTILQSKISDITKNFDRYEYFLYYNSGSSYSWPKTTTSPPYLLATTGSTEVLNWFGSVNEASSNYGHLLLSASNYDNANKDQLLKAIPEYLREDSSNQPYELFVDMVAQYYDNVWLYTKDVTQKYNADNRLDFGVSKDLVSDAIKDFGVKLYQNNFSNSDLYTAFLGLTPEGSLFPFPEITSSLPAPTGFEFVDTLISASNDIIPMDDVNKSLYKRIYHNIPYLLKSKGTIAGLRALITSYGIPDTILRISEFGGKDKANENDYDYYFNKFNYAFNTQGTNYLSTRWAVNGSDFSGGITKNPRTIQLRFKAENSPPTNYSQSLWNLDNGVSTQSSIVLEYTGSGLTSGSYSGSIKDPYYQYGTLKYINSIGESSSVYLPFFDGGWWSVMATVDSNDSASLYSGNKIYNGNDGTSLGYYASGSKVVSTGWTQAPATSSFANAYTGYSNFSGSLQEIRYYVPTTSESIFKDYIMNPLSIEGNSINSSPNELAFRASLGSELDTSTSTTQESTHPKITGSWVISQSFATGNSDYTFSQSPSFTPNTEYYFLDQFPAGIKNRITDKVRYENNVVPTGDTLSTFRRVTQQTEASASYTDNINYLEVAFSPQNEINDDIVSQLGYFNLGDYIGDPRQRSSSLDYYPELNNLSEAYFEKYIKNYDLVDFVRLIKFFDNSLFKMIKDFIPARTSLASGIVIKQHLLERNKYPQPQVEREEILLTGSINIGDIEGGPGGMLNIFNSVSTSPSGTLGVGPDNAFNLTQSWAYSNSTLSGSIPQIQDDQAEFYNGEFSGSTMLITNGELNSECDEFKNVSTTPVPYYVRFYHVGVSDTDGFSAVKSSWLSDNNQPLDGYLSILYNSITGPKADPSGSLYLKIPKIDNTGKDQSVSLESLTQITIPQTPNNITYQFTTVTEKPTFYLYDLIPNTASPDLYGKLNYDFTGSIDGSNNYYSERNAKKFLTQIPITASFGEDYGFYDLTTGRYIFNTYVQKDLYLKATGNIVVQTERAYLSLNRDNINNTSITQIETLYTFPSFFNPGVGTPFTLEFNLTSSRPGDIYFLGLNGDAANSIFTTASFNSSTFFVTSSAATATSSIDTILEPYFSSNFSLALDCQPLLNNVSTERPNPFLQDLDYQTSQTIPVNYQAVVSESATRATVPESNYTQLSSTNIRYNGSRNTGQQINKWSPNPYPGAGVGSGGFVRNPYKNSLNNEGNFGKTSPVTSAGTYAIYFTSSFTQNYSGSVPDGINKWGTFIVPSYIITPNQEVFEVGSDEDIKGLIDLNFTPPAPIDGGFYGNIDNNYNYIVSLFSPQTGVGTATELGLYKGNYINSEKFSASPPLTSSYYLFFFTTGSNPPLISGSSGPGIVYNNFISNTTSSLIPSLARELLSKNNII
tara:strand:- start:5225 stop:10375 length:5151 start_codon:yes stop_codon:yes gene_type:complete